MLRSPMVTVLLRLKNSQRPTYPTHAHLPRGIVMTAQGGLLSACLSMLMTMLFLSDFCEQSIRLVFAVVNLIGLSLGNFELQNNLLWLF